MLLSRCFLILGFNIFFINSTKNKLVVCKFKKICSAKCFLTPFFFGLVYIYETKDMVKSMKDWFENKIVKDTL